MSHHRGVVTAKVKSVTDQDGEGKVQLEYGWLPGKPRSAWAPIASPMSGKKRGHWFMPEIDDEVLVAFEHGDFAHPYVIGFLWNGGQKPPETDVKHRVIVTPGNHQLRFEDNDGAKKVILKTADGHSLTMDDAAKTVTVATKSGHSLTLDDTGKTAVLTTAGGLKAELADNGKTITLTAASVTATMDGNADTLVLRGGGRSVALQSSKVVIG